MASSSTSWSKSDWVSNKRGARALPRSFFERGTLDVARDLLGKCLVVCGASAQVQVVRIVETEAYHGQDPASHSARGETPRCSVMFGEAGRAYVYFIYGMYEMLNFVTEKKGYPGAVLIRAAEPVFGLEGLATNGPGKLCRALGIRMSDNELSLTGPRLKVCEGPFEQITPDEIAVSPRVGISAAQDMLWRFLIRENPYVSRAPQNKLARSLISGRPIR